MRNPEVCLGWSSQESDELAVDDSIVPCDTIASRLAEFLFETGGNAIDSDEIEDERVKDGFAGKGGEELADEEAEVDSDWQDRGSGSGEDITFLLRVPVPFLSLRLMSLWKELMLRVHRS